MNELRVIATRMMVAWSMSEHHCFTCGVAWGHGGEGCAHLLLGVEKVGDTLVITVALLSKCWQVVSWHRVSLKL